MIPIYRFRDGFGKMRRNAEVFEQFVDVLRKNEWLLMFPEGNHELRYTLRTLQKGIARIAFAAQVRRSWEREIPIIPGGTSVRVPHHLRQPPADSVRPAGFHAGVPGRSIPGIPRRPRGPSLQRVSEGFEAPLDRPPPDEAGYERGVQRWKLNKGRFPDLMDQFRADQEILRSGRRILRPDRTR